jgi:uncharacterized surface protein with fasciclin (FAS1) repeats
MAWTDDVSAGYTDANGGTWWTKRKTLIRKSTVQEGVTQIPILFNPTLEYDSLPDATYSNLGFHICDCYPGIIYGCTDPTATNYNPLATVDDGSCNTDCAGIIDGTAVVDSCGVCNQAFLYDFVIHTVTFIDDTVGVVPGPTEMLVMPDNPDNPYWNTSCVSNTIYDIVSNSEDHTTLKAAIDACALDAVLKGAGPFTLFAPTDAAFDALPPGTVSALLGDIPQLTDILKHHVVGDSVMSGMLSNNMVATTLNGTDITVYLTGGMVYIDNALVTVADIIADNGVVHVIDAVLLPEINSVGELNVINDKIYMYSVNILGEKVNKDLKNQIVFDIFNTGAVIKRFIK